jgi:hypothetical protein
MALIYTQDVATPYDSTMTDMEMLFLTTIDRTTRKILKAIKRVWSQNQNRSSYD